MIHDRALLRYLFAVLAVTTGVTVAAFHFPGGFDWAYTVISKLASRKHNPHGAVWLCISLLIAVILLWPVASRLGIARAGVAGHTVAAAALKVGLFGAAVLALEGLVMLDFSARVRKGHEVVAIITFLGLYAGIVAAYVSRATSRIDAAPVFVVVLPIVAVASGQLALYAGQRDIGWVTTSWRALGVPFWFSFAFWQWLAVVVLGAALGHLLLTRARIR